MTRLNNFKGLRKWSISGSWKIVDYVGLMNVSILITKRAEQFIVFKLRDIKDPGEVTGHRGYDVDNKVRNNKKTKERSDLSSFATE